MEQVLRMNENTGTRLREILTWPDKFASREDGSGSILFGTAEVVEAARNIQLLFNTANNNQLKKN